jgi:hypothetical protein
MLYFHHGDPDVKRQLDSEHDEYLRRPCGLINPIG